MLMIWLATLKNGSQIGMMLTTIQYLHAKILQGQKQEQLMLCAAAAVGQLISQLPAEAIRRDMLVSVA